MLKPSSSRESIYITPMSNVGIISIHQGIWNLIQSRKTMIQTKMLKPMMGTIIEVHTMEFVDVEVIIEAVASAEDTADGTIIEVDIMEVVDVEAIFEVVASAEDAADETITEVDNMELVDVEAIIEVHTMEWVDMQEASNNTADSMSGPMANQEDNIRTAMTWVRLSMTGSRGIRTT